MRRFVIETVRQADGDLVFTVDNQTFATIDDASAYIVGIMAQIAETEGPLTKVEIEVRQE